ncbi:S8 family serine peptidase [Pseudomonas putida]
MSVSLSFIFYRNFRFDGKIHVRCLGSDLAKVDRIRYELERDGSAGAVSLGGMSAVAQARSGKLLDHGCPASFFTEATAGTFTIRPKVVLLGQGGTIDMPPLVLQIEAGELSRNLLGSIPLGSSLTRNRRSTAAGKASPGQVSDPHANAQGEFPYREQGERYPPLQIKLAKGGYQKLLRDLEPGSGALLDRRWPGLARIIDLQPLLEEQERHESKLAVLADYCSLKQPASMLNDTFVSLIQTLAALEYVEALDFVAAVEDPPAPFLIPAAIIATLLTGTAVYAGNKAFDNAQPTPDFESHQYYLEQPSPRWQGLNIRQVWDKQVVGRGARVHFSDGGLFPDHEDLRTNANLKVVTSEPNQAPEHGTASVGIMLATRNGSGVTGICHAAQLYLYNNYAGTNGSQTLKDLLRHVEPGDIVGINRHSANIEVLSTFLPTVHERSWWDTAQQLTARGAIVLFAAGNGSSVSDARKGTALGHGVDLAAWPHFDNHGDAEAILVGACQSWDGKPHQYSNYRYPYRMLNAWGDSVTTLSYGDLQDKSDTARDYTARYGGTSSATPLVAGALSLIQSYAIEHHHIYLDADQMHLLVMASGYQDATLPDSEALPMGARPNVHAALVQLDRILGGGRFQPPTS